MAHYLSKTFINLELQAIPNKFCFSLFSFQEFFFLWGAIPTFIVYSSPFLIMTDSE